MMFAGLSQLRAVFRPQPAAAKHILVVNGHPDPAASRYCAALCEAYAQGVRARAGVRRLDVGAMALPEAGYDGWPLNRMAEILERMWWADRLFLVFPMWLGGAPPALRLILDEFARRQDAEAALLGLALETKAADVVVTASLPGLLYRTAAGVPVGGWAELSGLCVAQTRVIGSVESISRDERRRWLEEVRRWGASPR